MRSSCQGCVFVVDLLPSSGHAGSCPPCSLPFSEQTYCDRLVQDTPFLMGHGRLSEQQVDKIILQLNRYYPQILSNKDAEKVLRGGPDISLFFLSVLEENGRKESSEVKTCLFVGILGQNIISFSLSLFISHCACWPLPEMMGVSQETCDNNPQCDKPGRGARG